MTLEKKATKNRIAQILLVLRHSSKLIMIFLLILTALTFGGCSLKKDTPVDQQEEYDEEEDEDEDESQDEEEAEEDEEVTEQPTQAPEDSDNPKDEPTPSDEITDDVASEVINNGGLYVEYKGEVYYRQYTADSFYPDGLWGDYGIINGAPKNMMRIKADGTREIAFSDKGNGKIFIYQDRMYLSKYDESYRPILYSVNLDGSNELFIGYGEFLELDEKNGYLICYTSDENYNYSLARFNCAGNEMKVYSLYTPFSTYLGYVNGVIYYSGDPGYENSYDQVIICSVNIDGSDEKQLVNHFTDLNEYQDYYLSIVNSQIVDNTLYFVYGGYAGTGHFFQGGHIGKVNLDGSGFEILLGAPGSLAAEVTDEIFYVANINGNHILYYRDLSVKNYALHLQTGRVEPVSLALNPEGIPFEYMDGISIFENGSTKPKTLIPYVDYSYLGVDLNQENYLFTIKDIEECKDYVYYKLEVSERDTEYDIGWREGYRRLKSLVIRQDLSGEIVEFLYEY